MASHGRRRMGFTLIEMMISLTLLMFIIGTATQYMRKQSNLVTREAVRADALQNAQFAVSQIDRELREAGAGVVDIQPMLVQLDTQALTFNANMVSIDTGDVHAVYQLSDADTTGTRAMYVNEAVPLPNSVPSKLYPDTTYLAGSGIISGAETISYYLRPDSTTTLPNRYLLMRRVNALTPTVIARGIVKDPRDTVPFLTYYKADTLNRLVPIARSLMPIYHVKMHGDVTDTGRAAITDSIRAVRVHLLAVSRDQRATTSSKDNLRVVESLVRLMNSGLLDRTSCGQPPLGVSQPTAVSSVVNAPSKWINVTWSKSSDDGGGEKDVVRYAIFRRIAGAPAFGDPITSIPAGQASYSFKDSQIVPGNTYEYGIAAQDCTPNLSGLSASLPVTANP